MLGHFTPSYSQCWCARFGVADPGEPPTSPPLFLDQTEVRRAEKIFWGDPPPPLPKGLDDQVPPLSQGTRRWARSEIKPLMEVSQLFLSDGDL